MKHSSTNLMIKPKPEVVDERDERQARRAIKSIIFEQLDETKFMLLSRLSGLLSDAEANVFVPDNDTIGVLNSFRSLNLHHIHANGDLFITVNTN
jgi:hypothetical protein